MEQGTAETVTTVLAAVPTVSGVTFTYDLTITAGVIVAILSGLIAWIRSRGKAIDDKIAAHDERMGRHETRIAATEQTLNHMPAKGDLHALQISLADIRGELGRLSEAQKAATSHAIRTDSVLERVEGYLLQERRQ